MAKNVRGTARLGVLAVGLGIGAAWAHMPLASADSSGDAASTIDSLISGLPAAPTPIDIDISFDGYTIYDGGGSAVAFTTSGSTVWRSHPVMGRKPLPLALAAPPPLTEPTPTPPPRAAPATMP